MATIYIYLKNEGTDVWRPVQAEPVSGNAYRIVSVNTDLEDEEWEFDTGELVRCESRVFSGGKTGLVAVERLSATI